LVAELRGSVADPALLLGRGPGGDADGLVPRGERWRGRRRHDVPPQLSPPGPGWPHPWIWLGW